MVLTTAQRRAAMAYARQFKGQPRKAYSHCKSVCKTKYTARKAKKEKKRGEKKRNATTRKKPRHESLKSKSRRAVVETDVFIPGRATAWKKMQRYPMGGPWNMGRLMRAPRV